MCVYDSADSFLSLGKEDLLWCVRGKARKLGIGSLIKSDNFDLDLLADKIDEHLRKSAAACVENYEKDLMIEYAAEDLYGYFCEDLYEVECKSLCSEFVASLEANDKQAIAYAWCVARFIDDVTGRDAPCFRDSVKKYAKECLA